jgi:thiamine biosynthesis lipoprotein
MASRFEVFLVGDDDEHLRAVGEAALEEVSRIERLLSRFDPASEVSRLNRDAFKAPVRVDRELFALLVEVREWSGRTDGYFDPCATGLPGSSRFLDAVELDEATRSVRFLDRSARLDLGGYGKGSALDAAARVLDEFGVTLALMHGGTSSVLARGRQPDGSAWRVGLGEGGWVDLVDRALSTSASFRPGQAVSDLVDPVTGRPLDRSASCSVVAPSASAAEALSTAFLAMGLSRAKGLVGSFLGVFAAWIDEDGVEWIGEGRPR